MEAVVRARPASPPPRGSTASGRGHPAGHRARPPGPHPEAHRFGTGAGRAGPDPPRPSGASDPGAGTGTTVAGRLGPGLPAVLRGRPGGRLDVARRRVHARGRGGAGMSEGSTLSITSVELVEVAIPLVRPFRTSFGEE